MNIDFDEILDYKTEYSSRLQKVKVKGNKLSACCPFHNEDTPSFSVDLKTGKFNCFGCGANGNYTSFRAQLDRISTKDAHKKICEENNIPLPEKPKPQTTGPSPYAKAYTVAEYAMEKRLPKDWLESVCLLKQAKDRDGAGYIKIPYYNVEGEPWIFRKRYPKGSAQRFKWSYGSAGKIIMYGEWNIPQYYEDGYAIIVEGESDTQTLWYLGFNALGCPGASMMKAEWVQRFGDIPKLFIHIEPDQGGELFQQEMMRNLKAGNYAGEVYLFTCKSLDVKDPSELFIKYSDETVHKVQELLRTARRVNIQEYSVPENIADAPKHLRCPDGWKYSDKGIFWIDPKNGFTEKLISRTPIILTERLKSLDTGEEKIEVAFKRDGKWSKHSFSRSTIFQSRNIVQLADLGCTVTSENARDIIKFLSALEAENIDIIERVESTSTFGWQPGGRFIPGNEGNIHIDVAPTMQGWVAGYSKYGTLEDWVNSMRKARENPKFRFILAAAFAAPLLKIIKCRNFMVYNWADSKGGKTATLKAALSVWGNPERIMATFNATQVALERMAGIFNDLPMGLDERQLAGTKTEFVDRIVYMLANGAGKLRGSKTGELQEHKVWRSIIMATGEEPIINDRSMDGVSTRLVEIGGAPFDNPQDAAAMHSASMDNYGWAGPKFINCLLKLGADRLIELYQKLKTGVTEVCDILQKDLDANKVAMVAAITLADVISSHLFWRTEESLEQQIIASEYVAADVMEAMTNEEITTSTNASATEYLSEWLNMKYRHFAKIKEDDETGGRPREVLNDGNCDLYGQIDEINNIAYIFSTVLHDALEAAKFNHRKSLKYMAEQGIIKVDPKGKFAIVKQINGKLMRAVAIYLDKLTLEEPENETSEVGDIEGTVVNEVDLPF